MHLLSVLQFVGSGLKSCSASASDFVGTAGKSGEEGVDGFLDLVLSAEADVGGCFLPHPVPDSFVGVEVRAIGR